MKNKSVCQFDIKNGHDNEITKNNLKTHEESLHGGKKFPCELCDYLATYKSSLRTHIKSVHEREKFPCESCDYILEFKSCLRTHNE